ncbi:hypothetical protein Vadar_024989 [Vaccinium darrowii]|uniref:Uncharacterized protein n=2 Tax=Vaccinium darrowii TaxID=229202 RepID=A0ACB7ZGZ8_9ERIC|nr:hypothetical protein Vadar_002506 [Vaccinium darrowii]KAH7866787.1 hypothetical protein Vadar_024989 [Vaccinium darrowii]
MEFKAPTNHHVLLILVRLLLLLVLVYLPFAMANTARNDLHNRGPSGEHRPLAPIQYVPLEDNTEKGPSGENKKGEDDSGLSNLFELTEEPSVEQNKSQSCTVPELQCQPCPSVFECPLTLEPEAFMELKNNLGPVIRQRLMELLEKTRIVESAFEVVHTIDMLKLLDESNSEFNVVREHMHNGAQRLRDASHKLLGKKMQPQYVS